MRRLERVAASAMNLLRPLLIPQLLLAMEAEVQQLPREFATRMSKLDPNPA